MLELMGQDLASVHLGIVDRSDSIQRDLSRRKRADSWLPDVTRKAVAFVKKDNRRWKEAAEAS
jgi:hypothetical protein